MSFGGGDGYGGERGDAEPGRRGTRTRLPEGEGGSRPPVVRPGKSLVTIVGVIVLLIAALAFATRSGGDGDGGGGGDGKGGKAQPTAPTGVQPVPSGFARTEQGAQSAAANYAVALSGDGMYDDDKRESIVTAVYAPEVAAERKADLDRVYTNAAFLKRIGLTKDGTPPKGMTFVSRTNPVGTKVEEYSNHTAKVSVWYSSLFGLAGEDSKNPVSEAWYTNTFQLQWVKGDWKVTDFDQKDGPVPVGRDQRASSAEEMAEAIEGFGGFTYAR
ncbi:hypothetical protein [Streptomyces gobiensis]|uniref:hypothetical protein n=1 Tax=Streptomyces gobiensis TaxID=2875706 RepID=UPI001E63034B|nr:hypothetical protein [Streptomyces gobiensis]UGY92824.1 hypothetical protein test1122_14680 [Streptomyces gobiensis]